jgi:hypothetical protein
MTIVAEVLSSPTAAPRQFSLPAGSAALDAEDAIRIALQLRAADVANYVRQGDDLVLFVVNGEKVQLRDFFHDNGGGSQPTLALVGQSDTFVALSFDSDIQGPLAVRAMDPLVDSASRNGGTPNSGTAGSVPIPMVAAGLAGGLGAVAAATDSSAAGSAGKSLPDDKGVVAGARLSEGEADSPAPVSAPLVTLVESGDRFFTDRTVTLGGIALPGATVEAFIDGVSVGTTVADAEGAWTFSHQDGSLRAGRIYEVTVRQADADGTWSPASDVASLVVPTTCRGGPIIEVDAFPVVAEPVDEDAAAGHRLGSNDIDALQLSGSGVALDFPDVTQGKTTGIQIVDASGRGAGALLVAIEDVLDMSHAGNLSGVEADAGGREAAAFFHAGSIDASGTSYDIYENGGAAIWMEDAATVTI